MQLKFEISQEYDSNVAFEMLRGDDWDYRRTRMGIDRENAQKINRAEGDEKVRLKKIFEENIDKEYQKLLPYMEKTRDWYQQSWDEISDEFSETIERITCPWFYEDYVCVLTNYNPGISNWNGNVVARWWKENPYLQRRITAHEILLAHYFSIHKNKYPDSGLNDKQIWALAEIAAIALTGLEEKIMKFWPWDKKGYYTDHNYPQIVELQNQLKKHFLERKNFDEYIKKGIELVRGFDLD